MSRYSAVGNGLGSRRESPIGTLVVLALLVLALAGTCAAAPGTSVVSGITATSPGGFVFTAECLPPGFGCTPTGVTTTWVTDASKGFCPIIPGAVGGASKLDLPHCIKPTATSLIGQPAFDPVAVSYTCRTTVAAESLSIVGTVR